MIPKTYCPYPFISASLQADNTVLPCGQFMKSVHFKKVIPINEVRNGEFMKSMREKMLNGEHVEGCQCPAEEAAGMRSMRQSAIEKFGFTTETKLKKLELVFDNVCNIKCRSCGSPNSHLWYEDELEIYGEGLIGKKYVKNTLYNDVDFSDLEAIEVLGGEPMISPGTAEFFKKSKDLNILKNLSIQISTNGVEIASGHILTALLECKNLSMDISIDAYGEYNNYVRSGSDWNKILQSMEFYYSLFDKRPQGTTKISIHTTVSIYNANQLDILENFIADNFPKFRYSAQVLQYPIFMSIKNTPKEYKDAIRDKIKDQGIVAYMDSGGQDLFSEFINYSKKLDNLRNESMGDHNPFLKEFIDQYPNKTEFKREIFLKFLNDIRN